MKVLGSKTKRSLNTRWARSAATVTLAAAGLMAGCNSHPVQFTQSEGSVAIHQDRSPDSAAAVDVLWVIDNSGSMCQEQDQLRTNFNNFIERFGQRNIDFHIGVTTTQTKDDYSFEDVARPGYLQSTPQPVPTYDETCHGDEGDEDDPMDGYAEFRASIDLAVQCTKNPAQWQDLKNVTDDEIADVINRVGGIEYDALFPSADGDESPYRDIPKVLASEDYVDSEDGTLDIEQLRADFNCASTVGTRGWSIEKGLEAAVTAVSPALTGGSDTNVIDETAPNAGFLRDEAVFSLIFVTDENDCSHDGTLNEENSCSASICAFANAPDFEDSPLTPVSKLHDDLVSNLEASKGRPINEDSIVVASINGKWKRYGQDYLQDQAPTDLAFCDERAPEESIEVIKSCFSDLGDAYSGDRYDRFLGEFNEANVFPKPLSGEGTHRPGLICTGTFDETLSNIADTIVGSVSQCIRRSPKPCQADADCPAYAFGDGAAACTPFGSSEAETAYCDSAVQLRLSPGDGEDAATFADLEANEFCIPDSIGSQMTPNGCVVDRSQYSFEPCSGAETKGINLVWTDPLYFEKLTGYKVELVYAYTPPGNAGGSSAQADAGADGS